MTLPEIPLINSDKVYFVHDNAVEDSQELVPVIPTIGNLQREYFIHIIADGPVKASGQLNLPCALVLPCQSNFKDLNAKGKSISCSKLTTYQQAHELADTIETFDEQLYKIRTADAYLLLKDRTSARSRSPHFFPDLLELCPKFFMLSHSDLEVLQRDYITANNPLIYIAKSIPALKELQMNLPEFGLSTIYYINPDCSQSGVYCTGPLFLNKGFDVHAKDDLTVFGFMKLNDYNLKLTSSHSIWMIGATIKLGGSIIVRSGKEVYMAPLYKPLQANVKPEHMPEEDWARVLMSCIEFGLFN